MAKLSPGDPLELNVKGSSGSEILVKNILVGEVWLCSGQSNMEMPVRLAKNSGEEIAAAKYPQIRLFTVPRKKARAPQSDCKGRWVECQPETIPNFSALAYFFGRKIHRELNLPIGVIHSS